MSVASACINEGRISYVRFLFSCTFELCCFEVERENEMPCF